MVSNNIKRILKLKNVKDKEIAEKCGWSASTFSQRLNRNTWKIEDLQKIADALNCDLEISFKERD